MRFVRWIVGLASSWRCCCLSLQNAEPVTLRFYHWLSWEAPLIFLLLIVFALGVAAGLLAGAVRSARLKRQLTACAASSEAAGGAAGAAL